MGTNSSKKEYRLEYDIMGNKFLVTIENNNVVARSRFLGSMSTLKFLNNEVQG